MYELNAVIGGRDLLRVQTVHFDHAVVAVLRQGMALLPVTDQLFEEMTGAQPEPFGGPLSADRPFYQLMSPAFERSLSEWSRHGPIAYVEADFFGGDGYQSAVLWRDGAREWGPAFDCIFDGPQEMWPINAALARLGATLGDWALDLFAAIGLGLEQDMKDWLSYARAALTPEYFDALAERQAREEADRELARIPVDLDGHTIMTLLDIPPGPLVGAAMRHLRLLRRERGPLSHDEAEVELRTWAREQGVGVDGETRR